MEKEPGEVFSAQAYRAEVEVKLKEQQFTVGECVCGMPSTVFLTSLAYNYRRLWEWEPNNKTHKYPPNPPQNKGNTTTITLHLETTIYVACPVH